MAHESVTPMTLINSYLRQLNLCGYNPRNRTLFKILFGFTLWLVTFTICCLQFVFLVTNTYEDFGSSMVDIVSSFGIWQHGMKLWTLHRMSKLFFNLLNIVEVDFLPLDNLPPFERSGIQAIYNFVKLICKSYSFSIGITVFGHIITAYFREKENLVMNIWMPDSLREWNRHPFGHHVIFGIQAIILTLSTISGLTAIDGMFMILIALLVGQLRILKYKLLAINGESSTEINNQEIIQCIEHHNLLLGFLKNVEEIFSTPLLHVAGTNIVIAVISMYACMKDSDIFHVMSYVTIIIASYSQLLIQCVMGQYIQDETESVANAAYLCKWEDIPDKNIRHSLMLLILRAQKHVNLTIGGVFILSLATFTQVSKMMYTLLTSMLNFDVGK